MATKPLKNVKITVLSGDLYEVADTASASIASAAIAQFDRHETVVFPYEDSGDEGIMKIPFHAILSVFITVETTTVEEADPYCEA